MVTMRKVLRVLGIEMCVCRPHLIILLTEPFRPLCDDDNNSNNNNKKAKLITVVTGATGTVSKSRWQYLSNILGKHEIKELQEGDVLGTAHIPRKVLM